MNGVKLNSTKDSTRFVLSSHASSVREEEEEKNWPEKGCKKYFQNSINYTKARRRGSRMWAEKQTESHSANNWKLSNNRLNDEPTTSDNKSPQAQPAQQIISNVIQSSSDQSEIESLLSGFPVIVRGSSSLLLGPSRRQQSRVLGSSTHTHTQIPCYRTKKRRAEKSFW